MLARQMVKIQGTCEYDKLDTLVNELVKTHGLIVEVTGWTRKTYDVYCPSDEQARTVLLYARIESFATTNGQISVFDERAMPFAEELGAAFETQFDIEEAVIVRSPRES